MCEKIKYIKCQFGDISINRINNKYVLYREMDGEILGTLGKKQTTLENAIDLAKNFAINL
jgi:hypothetical protein